MYYVLDFSKFTSLDLKPEKIPVFLFLFCSSLLFSLLYFISILSASVSETTPFSLHTALAYLITLFLVAEKPFRNLFTTTSYLFFNKTTLLGLSGTINYIKYFSKRLPIINDMNYLT